MTASAIFIFSLAVAQTPGAGDYKVVTDEIETKSVEWGVFCGTAKASEASSVGQVLKVTVDGNEWRATGGGRRFGSETCEGENLSLTLQNKQKTALGSTFECASTRVVKGAEVSKHIANYHAESKTISFTSENVRTFRVKDDLCRLKVSRKTQIKSLNEPIQPIQKDESKKVEVSFSAPEDKKTSCNVVGEPRRLKYFGPSPTTLIKGKRFCFNVKAVDSKGCVVEWAPIRWKISPRKIGRLNKRGCLIPATNNKRTKGRLIARSGKRQLSIPFRIAPRQQNKPPERAAVDAGQGIIKSEALSNNADAGNIPQKAAAPPNIETKSVNHVLQPTEKRTAFPAWLGLFLIFTSLLGWVVFRVKKRKPAWQREANVQQEDLKCAGKIRKKRRRKKKRKKKRRRKKIKQVARRQFKIVRGQLVINPATGILTPSDKKKCRPGTDFDSDLGPAPLPEYCTECGRRYPPSPLAKCPIDGALLEPLTSEVPMQTANFEIHGRLCPICYNRFEPDVAFCPQHNEPLVADLGQWELLKEQLLEKNEQIMVQRSAKQKEDA